MLGVDERSLAPRPPPDREGTAFKNKDVMETLMARNQNAMGRLDTATLATESYDPSTLFMHARAERDAYVGALVLKAIDGIWNHVLRPVFKAMSRRRTMTQIRSLDAHMLADIGVDAMALDKGLIQRRSSSDLPVAGPAMWPQRPQNHSVPLSDIVPGANAANDPRRRSDRVA